ncbi:MAG: Lon protease family protein [Pseudomonadales bacterium]
MKLSVDALRRRAEPDRLGFATTADLIPERAALGQGRAEEALAFAASMPSAGYHVCTLGTPSLGMLDFVRVRLMEFARERSVPNDLCYVNHFADAATPRLCPLPPGIGSAFRTDVNEYLNGVRATLPAALRSDEFQRAAQTLVEQLQRKQADDVSDLEKEASRHGLAMLPTSNGFAFAPVQNEKILEQETFNQLDEPSRQRLSEAIERMNRLLAERLRAYPRFQEDLVRQQRALTRNTATDVLTGLIAPLKERYRDFTAASRHLDDLIAHLLDNVDRIVLFDQGQAGQLHMSAASATAAADQFYRQCEVNLLINNGDLTGAPVIYESNPSLDNLVGKLEHRFEYGTPTTDFNLIRPGALHRANGGFLILDLDRVLQKPFAWDALKRCLMDQSVRVESVGQLLNLTYSVSLDPEPAPLDVKVILIGNHALHQGLGTWDADFETLFKVTADFSEHVPWTEDNQQAFARLLAGMVHDSGVRHLTAAAVAETVEHASRLMQDRTKLSTQIRDIEDVLREANFAAERAHATLIDRDHIRHALEKHVYRIDRTRELIYEDVARGIVAVATRGHAVGQINGLSVVAVGQLIFGQVARITATARIGRGEVIDIERESRLGGNIHRKAMLIVTSFLGGRYATEEPLSLSAALVFEQSYGGIEGDSASIAEVCALVSAVIRRPLRQDIAVTGSMDQHGSVQAIGRVNEKIEGFFDICKAQGLTGTQGVLIPDSNRDHLMLRLDVRDAVAAGRFSVSVMKTVDDAFALLFSSPNGATIDADTINREMHERLQALFRMRQRAGYALPDGGQDARIHRLGENPCPEPPTTKSSRSIRYPRRRSTN